MGLTSAMLVGFTGIKSNQYTIDTVGDNVANVNTTAFKNQRALFETVHYNTIADGTAPNGPTQGGTNPRQTGLGSRLAALDRNFEPGSIEGTGSKSDVAIDGDGFLIVETPDNTQLYTRDGSFRLDAENKLVASNGYVVQGFAADSNGEIITGALSELTIPLGTESAAVATTVAEFDGNLDAGASLSTRGAESRTEPLLTASGVASASTALTSLVDDDGVGARARGDVGELEGDEPTADEEDPWGERVEVQEAGGVDEVIGAREVEWSGSGAGGDQGVSELVVGAVDVEPVRAGESCGAVEGVDAVAPEAGFHVGGDGVGEAVHVGAERRPIDGQSGRVDAFAGEEVCGVDDLGASAQDLLRVTSP